MNHNTCLVLKASTMYCEQYDSCGSDDEKRVELIREHVSEGQRFYSICYNVLLLVFHIHYFCIGCL